MRLIGSALGHMVYLGARGGVQAEGYGLEIGEGVVPRRETTDGI